MVKRIKVSPLVQALFRNAAAESGLTTDGLIEMFDPTLAHSTVSRSRTQPPENMASRQFLMFAKLVEMIFAISPSRLIAINSSSPIPTDVKLNALASAEVLPYQSDAEHESVKDTFERIALTSRARFIFDREVSFSHSLLPTDDEIESLLIGEHTWLPGTENPCPRTSMMLTVNSLASRSNDHGNESIERLLDHIDRDGQTLMVIDDSSIPDQLDIFEDARAVAIIDRRALLLLPRHNRAVRLYDANRNSLNADIINLALRELSYLRRFEIRMANECELVGYLESYLSYDLTVTNR